MNRIQFQGHTVLNSLVMAQQLAPLNTECISRGKGEGEVHSPRKS
jgi:hypothetical protein